MQKNRIPKNLIVAVAQNTKLVFNLKADSDFDKECSIASAMFLCLKLGG